MGHDYMMGSDNAVLHAAYVAEEMNSIVVFRAHLLISLEDFPLMGNGAHPQVMCLILLHA